MYFLIFLASAVDAQAAEFCADRPGLATGSCIVPRGSIQFETSLIEWTHSKSGSEKSREYAVGATRVRFGIAPETDFHIAVTPLACARSTGESEKCGFADTYLGVKHRYLASKTVELAALPFVKLPTASDDIGNKKVEFGLILPVDLIIPAPWMLTVTPEIDWNSDEDGTGRHLRLAFATSIGLPISDRWSVAIDGLVGRELDRRTVKEAVAGLSVTHQLRPSLQLDAEMNLGLGPEDADIRIATGFAARF